MRDSRPRRSRGIALPTMLCSLIGGGAVAVLALTGLPALDDAAAPAPAPMVLPPAAVVVRALPVPEVTAAPTAREWTTTLPVAAR